MADLSILAGATSQSVNVFIQDNRVGTGVGLTGLVFNTASLTAYYTFAGANATAVAITLATLAAVNSAYSSGGFKEIDATNMPGWYRLDLPNAALVTSKGRVATIHLRGAANMVEKPFQIELTGWDNQLVPGAAGGMLIAGSNTGTTTFGALTCTGSLTVSDGLLISRSSSNTSAITATGNGTGSGAVFTSGSGATGDGVQATSVATNGNGLALQGKGTGAGEIATGGLTGNGAKYVGGGTSGDGILITTTSGHGINSSGAGTTKHGMILTGGATTSAGLACVGGATSGDGILVTTTSGHGVNIAGGGTTKHGIFSTGGATTSAGLALAGGGTSGDGVLITATSGHGINTTGTGTTKHGISATGGATSSDGIRATGGGTGNGINAISGSGATGDGIVATASSTNGNGMTLTHSGSGKDFNATTTPLVLAKTTNITGFNDIAATDVWAAATRTLTSGANIVLAKGVGVTGFNDITAAAAATGVWQDTTAGDFTVASSIGKSLYTSGNAPGAASGLALVGSNMGTVSSVTGNVGGNVVGSVASVTARVTANADQWAGGTIPAPNVTGVPLIDLKYTLGTISPATAGSVRADAVTGAVGSVTGSVGSVTGAVGSVTGAVGSVTAAVTITGDLSATMKTSVENAVWDATLASHLNVGSTGAALNAAGAAGDPWLTNLPGAYGLGTAGNIVGNKLDATVSSRAQPSDVPTANQNADALLDRAAGIETGITPRQGLRVMLSAMVGKLSGAGTTTVKIRDTQDTKDRITATVDAQGDRTAVTLNVS